MTSPHHHLDVLISQSFMLTLWLFLMQASQATILEVILISSYSSSHHKFNPSEYPFDSILKIHPWSHRVSSCLLFLPQSKALWTLAWISAEASFLVSNLNLCPFQFNPSAAARVALLKEGSDNTSSALNAFRWLLKRHHHYCLWCPITVETL